ncbi:hypothetical protein ACFWJ4_30000 [Kitasatospora sp. NPDC127067]|uniref:hypothetical protein n=1 Tax=Kitasatospora sp. NPDC127067 TaxID=3347126 RepID=UPI0036614EA0
MTFQLMAHGGQTEPRSGTQRPIAVMAPVPAAAAEKVPWESPLASALPAVCASRAGVGVPRAYQYQVTV